MTAANTPDYAPEHLSARKRLRTFDYSRSAVSSDGVQCEPVSVDVRTVFNQVVDLALDSGADPEALYHCRLKFDQALEESPPST